MDSIFESDSSSPFDQDYDFGEFHSSYHYGDYEYQDEEYGYEYGGNPSLDTSLEYNCSGCSEDEDHVQESSDDQQATVKELFDQDTDTQAEEPSDDAFDALDDVSEISGNVFARCSQCSEITNVAKGLFCEPDGEDCPCGGNHFQCDGCFAAYARVQSSKLSRGKARLRCPMACQAVFPDELIARHVPASVFEVYQGARERVIQAEMVAACSMMEKQCSRRQSGLLSEAILPQEIIAR